MPLNYHSTPDTDVTARRVEQVAMTVVTLRPSAAFVGERLPSRADVQAMHQEAHEQCLIASSVRTEVRCEPVYAGR